MTERGKDQPADISDDANTLPWDHSPAPSRSSTDGYKKRPQGVTKGYIYHTRKDRRKTAEKTLEVDRLMLLKPGNDLFTDVVDYWQYRLIKKSVRNDDDVAHELGRMKRKVAVLRKDKTFGGRDLLSVIGFLQAFKVACDAFSIPEGFALWLFKKIVTKPVENVIKARMTLPTESIGTQERRLRTYPAVINFLLKSYATDDKIAIADGAIQKFWLGALSASDFTQQDWTKTLKFCSVPT